MNRLTLRVLTGAACTVGFLALGLGVAHADDSSTSQNHGLLGVKVDLGLGSATHGSHQPAVKVDLGAKVAKVAKVTAKVSTPSTQHRTTPVKASPAKAIAVKVTANVATKPAPAKAVPAKAVPAKAIAVKVTVNVATKPAPVKPTPAKATPAKATPAKPTPAKPTPAKATPAKPTPAKATPAKATPAKATPAKAKLLDAKVVVNTGGPNVLGGLVTATADVASTVLGDDVAVCARVNAGDCEDPATGTDTNGSDPTTGSDAPNLGGLIPSVVADVDAHVADVPVDACVRVNASGCTADTDTGAGSNGTDLGTGIIPSVQVDAIADVLDVPVAACVRINADDCTATAGDPTGGGLSGIIPPIATDVTAGVTDVVDGVICVRINGGSCGTTVDPTDPTDPVTPTDPTDPGTPTDPTDPGTPTDPSTPNVPATPVDGPQGDQPGTVTVTNGPANGPAVNGPSVNVPAQAAGYTGGTPGGLAQTGGPFGLLLMLALALAMLLGGAAAVARPRRKVTAQR